MKKLLLFLALVVFVVGAGWAGVTGGFHERLLLPLVILLNVGGWMIFTSGNR